MSAERKKNNSKNYLENDDQKINKTEYTPFQIISINSVKKKAIEKEKRNVFNWLLNQ